MIIIADDTYGDRYKFNEVAYLSEPKYTAVCRIYEKIKTPDLSGLMSEIESCALFCYHNTLQLYDEQGEALPSSENERNRSSMIRIAGSTAKPIKFSGRLDTNFDRKELEKSDFYSNLKEFLEDYIEAGEIELKILFWGKHHEQREFDSVVNALYKEIRMTELSKLTESEKIVSCLEEIFPNIKPLDLLKVWRKKELSKREIFKYINENID